MKYVDISEVEAELQPLLQESKNYLYTKGFTESELLGIIQSENGNELDIIPFAMVLASAEQDQSLSFSKNFPSFFNSAIAQESDKPSWKKCAVQALGFNFVLQAATEPNASWGKEAMTKAFISIIKRMMGPWGVLITVAAFAASMHGISVY